MSLLKKWEAMLGAPSYGKGSGNATLTASFSQEEFDAEWYSQETGEGRHQRVLVIFPKCLAAPAPTVVVPFYFPEAMLGYDPATGEKLERYHNIEMMLHLVRRGYIAASADAYHLTYIDSAKERGDFSRWQDAANALHQKHPQYSGMGKLVDDTRLVIDLLTRDRRVDATRIGIAGHSLGGKMAFYTGCLDPRVRAILASDFGIGWHQTNWDSDWYFGKTPEEMLTGGYDHAELLGAAQKPFCLIAGQYDTDESHEIMCRAAGYDAEDERLCFINHATGHRPPLWALTAAYDFLDKWLK